MLEKKSYPFDPRPFSGPSADNKRQIKPIWGSGVDLVKISEQVCDLNQGLCVCAHGSPLKWALAVVGGPCPPSWLVKVHFKGKTAFQVWQKDRVFIVPSKNVELQHVATQPIRSSKAALFTIQYMINWGNPGFPLVFLYFSWSNQKFLNQRKDGVPNKSCTDPVLVHK